MSDPFDLLTLDEAKRAMSLSTSSVQQDDLLARMVTSISRIVDDRCGPVVQRTVTGEVHDGGSQYIHLVRRPVMSITTVREAQNGSILTLTQLAFGAIGDGYEAPTWDRDPTLLSGQLVRQRYGFESWWWPGKRTVEVTYEAGRCAGTDSVDPRFKECAGAILRRLWKREAPTWAQSASFFEDNDAHPGAWFFKVATPLIDELLWDEVQTHLAGFA